MAEHVRRVLGGVRVSEGVVAALRLAATERAAGSARVGTDTVIAALHRTDAVGDWSRVELHLGQPLRPDRSPTAGSYDGVPLSQDLCRALDGAVALMRSYGFPMLLPGLVAVAVLHARSTAPDEAESRRTEARAALTAVLDDVLGADLPGLDEVLDRPAVGTRAQASKTIDRSGTGAGRNLRQEAGAFVDGDDPGACGLLMAGMRGVESLERLRRRTEVLQDDDARSSELRGIPDEPADEVITRAVRDRGSARPADIAYTVLLTPSWRAWETLALRGVRPRDLAVAAALLDDDREAAVLPIVRNDLAGLARKVLWLWAIYTLVRHRDPSVGALLLAPKTWARDAPAPVTFLASALVFVLWGWVPACVVAGMAAVGAVAARSERRSLASFLGVPVSGAAQRRAVRLVERGGLALPNFVARTWVSKRDEALT